MKRADLVVGETYWFARGNDWMERESSGMKLVIIDAGCWQLPDYSSWSRSREPRRSTGGNGVLADVTVQGYGPDAKETTKRTVVNLTQIRGPYEETLKQVREFSEARRKREKERQDKSDDLALKIREIITRAEALGIKARRGGWQSDEIVLSSTELTKLLDMAQRESDTKTI